MPGGVLLYEANNLPGKVAFVKDFLKSVKLNEANISLLLGAVVIVLVGVLLFNYFGSINKSGREQTSSAATEVGKEAVSALPSADQLPAEYTIQKGDNLWNISEKVYGSGYQWTEIVNANEVLRANPGVLSEGMKITLPKLEPVPSPTETVKIDVKPEITPVEGEYVVVQGDSLWIIAVKTYGSGYNWVDIHQANKTQITNPNLIRVGQKLILPKTETKYPGGVLTGSMYKVVRGDSLWTIASRYCGTGLAWNRLAEVNSLANPRLIEPGQTLRVECK